MDVLDAQTKKLIKPLEKMYVKAPALPISVKEFIVTVSPWVALILGVLSVAALAFAIFDLGASGVIAGSQVFALSGFGIVPIVAGLVSGILMLLAFKPLQKRTLKGWNLMFWVFVISLVSSLFSSLTLMFNVLSIAYIIVLVVIELYFLFQVKSYYK